MRKNPFEDNTEVKLPLASSSDQSKENLFHKFGLASLSNCEKPAPHFLPKKTVFLTFITKFSPKLEFYDLGISQDCLTVNPGLTLSAPGLTARRIGYNLKGSALKTVIYSRILY